MSDRPEPTPVWISRRHHQTSFDPHAAPVAVVDPGTRVRVETLDCFSNTITSPTQRFADNDQLLATTGALNPVTGPLHITGARAGDMLAIEVLAIDVALDAPLVTTVVPGLGGPTGQSDTIGSIESDTRLFSGRDGRLGFPAARGMLWLPARPMIGSIGTTPAQQGFPALESHATCGGNMDCPDVTVGATLLLPVEVEGGLLALGDVHAAMGDAEVTGTAVEASAEVTIRIDVIPGGDARVPRLLTAEGFGSVGCAFGATLEDNLERAVSDLVRWAGRCFELTAAEAYELVGVAARVRVNQCVPGGWSSMFALLPWACFDELPRDQLAERVRAGSSIAV